MPLIENDDLIKEYFETIKDQYPEITLDRLSRMLKAPFYFVRDQMSREDMPTIMFKYLGKFRTFSGKIKKLVDRNNKNLAFGHISVAEYERKRIIYDTRYKQLVQDEQNRKVTKKRNKII